MRVTNIVNCSRCGADHAELEATKLERPFAPPEAAPIEWTHFALCPTNGHPILIVTRDDAAEQIEAPCGSQQFEDALVIVFQVFQERRQQLGDAEAFASTVREFFGKWKPVKEAE